MREAAAAILAVAMTATLAWGGMVVTSPLPDPWPGGFACRAENVSSESVTIWTEIVEATNFGTVESYAPACLDVPPGGACDKITGDSRGRRCLVQWAGPDDALKVEGRTASEGQMHALSDRRESLMQRMNALRNQRIERERLRKEQEKAVGG